MDKKLYLDHLAEKIFLGMKDGNAKENALFAWKAAIEMLRQRCAILGCDISTTKTIFGGVVKTTNECKYCTFQEYLVDGKLHRADGPARISSNGDQSWYLNGQLQKNDSAVAERTSTNLPIVTKYGTKKWMVDGKLHREDGPAVEYSDGTKEWYRNGDLHREDGPAVEYADGYQCWYLNDHKYYSKKSWSTAKRRAAAKLHKTPTTQPIVEKDGPTIIYPNGDKEWYLNGQLHRVDGPAIELANGSKEWYHNGQCHRVDGPALEYANGYKEWWLNGKRHREDGPAVEYTNGSKSWWLNGKLHREDGPAIEWDDGDKEWYLNGTLFSKKGWSAAKRRLNQRRQK